MCTAHCAQQETSLIGVLVSSAPDAEYSNFADFVKLRCVGQLLVQVGLTWLDRWAKTLSGKDQAPFLCHQICGALLTAEQTGEEAGSWNIVIL